MSMPNVPNRVQRLQNKKSTQDELIHLIVKFQVDRDEHAIRRIIELLFERGDYLQAARWLMFRSDLSSYNASDLLQVNRLLPRPFLNIGGGPSFLYPMWENLDGVAGPLNPKPFALQADVRLPFKAGSFHLVYTSHTLEHLDDATVSTILAEARRVLRPGAALLVKIPDFDTVIDAWKTNRDDYFTDEWWGFGAHTPTFKNRGLSDSLLTRTAYIFCGFWNSQYGNHFDKYDAFAVGAYNGPVPMPEIEMIETMHAESPHKIASRMRDYVIAREQDYTFNHQNAWGSSEMCELISDAGFDMISIDKNKIVERFNYIPRISQMFEISSFFLASPKR